MTTTFMTSVMIKKKLKVFLKGFDTVIDWIYDAIMSIGKLWVQILSQQKMINIKISFIIFLM